MANGIGGNFNIPGGNYNKGNIGGQKKGPAEEPAFNTSDAVSFTGRGQEKPVRSSEDKMVPTELETSAPAPSAPSKAGANAVPTTLTMGGVEQIGGPKADINFSDLTGLNSLSSINASGKFHGQKGSYGPGNGLF